jgi:hypothetical protein
MDTKKVALVIAVAAIIAVGVGYVIAAYAQESNNGITTTAQPVTTGASWVPLKQHKGFEKAFRGGLRIPMIEVSPEYNSTIMNVLESNQETSQLLTQGFNVKVISPLIKAYVNANGEVVLKATQAVVTLTNGTAVYTYLVDISNNSVTLLSYHQISSQGAECGCVCKSTSHQA